VPSELELPLMGYFRLTDEEDVTMFLTGYSGLLGYYETGYRNYFLPISDSDTFNVYDIIPQYYEFAGHYQNYGSAADDAHDDPEHNMLASPANGSIVLDYGEDGEIWLTVYITPKDGDPGSYTWSYATNDFGNVPLPPPPIILIP